MGVCVCVRVSEDRLLVLMHVSKDGKRSQILQARFEQPTCDVRPVYSIMRLSKVGQACWISKKMCICNLLFPRSASAEVNMKRMEESAALNIMKGIAEDPVCSLIDVKA